MKIEIDRGACVKSGQCIYLHPELYALDAEDFPKTTVESIGDDLIEGAEESVELCPASALALVAKAD
ncbi:MAG: ferredoxin [Dehalococcoidia bacterium]|nr:ferredoxin [Dehalococcoidia bacterium]